MKTLIIAFAMASFMFAIASDLCAPKTDYAKDPNPADQQSFWAMVKLDHQPQPLTLLTY